MYILTVNGKENDGAVEKFVRPVVRRRDADGEKSGGDEFRKSCRSERERCAVYQRRGVEVVRKVNRGRARFGEVISRGRLRESLKVGERGGQGEEHRAGGVDV